MKKLLSGIRIAFANLMVGITVAAIFGTLITVSGFTIKLIINCFMAGCHGADFLFHWQ